MDWVYTTGTTGDDSGTGVAIDGFGHVYACGWKNGASNKRDIWIAKVDPDPSDGPPEVIASAEWAHTYTDPPGDVGDDAALGITLDGIDRVLVGGIFGKERPAGGGFQVHTLDFNPSAGTDNKTTAGGHDIFVTRLRYNGVYDWTFRIGGTYNDGALGISVDPVQTTRLGHAGYFGAQDAPNTYSVDFDPAPAQSAFLTTTARADGYASTLLPTIPSGIVTQTSLVIDNLTSMEFVADYIEMMPRLKTALGASNTVPQDGTAALNAIMFGYSRDTEDQARAIMPWTVFTSVTASQFARKLASIPQPETAGTNIDSGIREARRMLVGDRITSAYRSLLIITDGCNGEDEFDLTVDMAEARDEVLDVDHQNAEPDIDQINGLAVVTGEFGDADQPSQDYLWTFVVGSDKAVPANTFPFDWIGFALETTHNEDGFTDTDFLPMMQMLLRHCTRCPGDYDRNGVVDQVADLNAFIAGSQAGNAYADWNFDGVSTGTSQAGLTATCSRRPWPSVVRNYSHLEAPYAHSS